MTMALAADPLAPASVESTSRGDADASAGRHTSLTAGAARVLAQLCDLYAGPGVHADLTQPGAAGNPLVAARLSQRVI